MQIVSYEYKDSEWSFSPIELNPISLFVGASGSGKTRFFNTIFNLGTFISRNEKKAGSGEWNIRFRAGDQTYDYTLVIRLAEKTSQEIVLERLIRNPGSPSSKTLIDRDTDSFEFEGLKLPKFPASDSAIYLLRETPPIAPIHQAFGGILKRSFSSDVLETSVKPITIKREVIAKIDRLKSLQHVHVIGAQSLEGALQVLHSVFPKTFAEIAQQFREIFPFVSEIGIRKLSDLSPETIDDDRQVIAIREKGIRSWIHLEGLSSGMLKVLLILTDLRLMPSGGIYMIDEYENSLGVNAIDFLPDIMLEMTDRIQFLLISHHPYLINRIPIKDWYIFGRQGAHVQIRFGEELVSRYGASKQQAFVQLINDPFYLEGKE
jgi:predicted ATPase